MFKIESYVTPLILSYVSKYVKNIRPEDSQLSLWGGDAVFSNLDLRLEALEQELRLPFRLVNGHIHELRIHVPWTKLTSEPVVVTINTIECVLRLGDASSAGSSASSSSASSAATASARLRRVSSARLSSAEGSSQSLAQPPSGYLSGLLQRVLHNVTIVLNNVILKYAEEDLVLSLNIKSVELASADAAWQPAFAQLWAEDLVLRKLISMQDVTVCLDKGLSTYLRAGVTAGSHTYSHLTGSLFDPLAPENSGLPREPEPGLDGHVERLTELAMAERFPALCLDYLYELQVPEDWDEGGATDDQDQGWGAWAWSMVPQILPAWEEEPGMEGSPGDAHLGDAAPWPTLYHLGCYVEKMTCIFKTTAEESTGRGTRRQSSAGRPLVQLELHGSSAEVALRGVTWVHFQAGVTGAAISGSERCACGFEETARRGRHKVRTDFDSEEAVEISAAFLETSNWVERSLCRSVIGPSVVDITSGAVHRVLWLVECATSVPQRPAYGPEEFEPVHFPLPLPDEEQLERMSQFAPSRTYRLTVLKPRVRLCPSTHCAGDAPRQQTLLRRRSLREESPVSGGGPSALPGSCLPLLELQVECLDVSVGRPMYPGKMTTLLVTDEGRLPETLRHQCFSHLQAKLFGLSVDLASASSKAASRPPARVVLLDPAWATFRCQWVPCPPLLAHGPESLARTWGCLELFGLSVDLASASSKAASRPPARVVLLDPAWATFRCQWVPCPPLLAHGPESLARTWGCLEVGPLRLSASKQRAMAALGVALSWPWGPGVAATLGASSLVGNLSGEGSPMIQVSVGRASWTFSEDAHSTTHSADVVSISAVLHDKDRSTVLVHAPENTAQAVHLARHEGDPDRDLNRAEESWIRATARVPLDWTKEAETGFVVVKVKGVVLVCDPALVTWLAPLPMIFPTGSEFSPGPVPFSPTASDDGGLTFSDERSQDLPREARGSASGSQRSGPSLTSPPVAVGLPKRTNPASSEVSQWSNPASSPSNLGVRGWLRSAYARLRTFSVQVGVANVCLLFPKSPLLLSFPRQELGPPDASVPCVLPRWRRHLREGAAGSVACLLLPALNVTSTDPKSKRGPTAGGTAEHHESDPGERFPWCVRLGSWAAFEAHGAHVRHVLKPASLSCTVALTSSQGQDRRLSQLGLCIHVDVEPCHLSLSAKQLDSIRQTVLLLASLRRSFGDTLGWYRQASAVPSSAESFVSSTLGHRFPVPKLVPSRSVSLTESCDKVPEVPSGSVSGARDNAGVGPTLWLQWTLPKVGINLFGSGSEGSSAKDVWLQLEAEEVTASLDVQEVYSKVKLKMSTFNISCFEKSPAAASDTAWEPGPYEGVVFSCSEKLNRQTSVGKSATAAALGQQPKQTDFLNLTWTRALCAHVRRNMHKPRKDFTPLTEVERQAVKPRYLSEVDLRLAAFDIVLHTRVAAVAAEMAAPLHRLTDLLRVPLEASAPSKSAPKRPKGWELNSRALPLVYLASGTVRVFLPVDGGDAERCAQSGRGDVCLLQCGATSLSPQVENPLCRRALREDLYSWAQEQGVLTAVGSDLEDRQYQLHLSAFFLCTQASIPSDLHCHLSLDQLSLLHRVLSQLWHTGTLMGKFASSSAAGASAERGAFAGPRATPDFRDSGLESDLSEAPGSTQAEGASQSPLDFVPFDLLLTAATISLTLGLVEVDERPLSGGQRSPPCSDEDDVGYDASEDSDSHVGDDAAATLRHRRGSGGARMVPLARVVVLQPQAFLPVPSEQRAEMSCLDVQVGGVPSGFRAPGFNLSELASPGTFVEPWLETRPGEPHPKTGIPPSLFTLSLQGFLLPQVSLCVKVGRPLRVNLGASKVDQALQFAELAASQLMTARSSRAPPPQTAPTPGRTSSYTEAETLEVTSLKQWRLSAKLETDQLVLVLDFPMDLSNFKATLALESHTSEIDVECSPLGMPLGLQSRTTLAALQLYATSGQHRVSLAGPSTVSLCTDTFWERLSVLPAAHCILRVHCDVVPLRAGPTQLRLCAAAVQHAVQLIAQLQCDLQYWEPCQEQFVTYQQFELSESEPHSLDLPSLAFCSQDQPPPVVVADTWRVVILAAEHPASRHAEEGPMSAATAMSPLALAACMRVDSHFDPGLVPRLRASLSVDTCLLVLDVPSAPAAPLGLWPFELDESSTPGDLDFAEVSLNQLCLSYTGWQHRTNLGDLAIEADLVIEPCYLRVSQSVVHTLSTAAAFWDKDAGVSIPLSYIAVCNDTQDVVCFGQVIISGQVTLRCHLLRGLQIQLNLADPNSKEATTTARPPKMRSVQVDLGDGASRSLVLDPKRIYSFHVCRADPVGPSQTGPSVATTWSNEVELQSRLSKDWVEILEVLAFVPLHVLRSHLPCSLLVHLHRGFRKEEEEEERAVRGTLSVPGRGQDSPLLVDPVPTSLTFQLGPGMRVSSPALQLQPPTLDHETLVADSPRILEQLRDPQWPPGSPYCVKWPYHDPQRMVEVDHLAEKGALLPQLCTPSSSSPEHPQEMPETELRVSQYQDFPFAGTVLVDIKPWALVVNCTGQELRLVAGDHGVWTLAEGQVFAPPALYEPFYLGLEDGGDLHCSSRPLVVDRAYLLQRKESPQAPLDSAEQLLVGKPIPVCIPFRRTGSSSRLACRLVALASDFEGCLVVTLRSAVCLTNQTPLPLTAAGFVMAADPPYVELWTGSKEMAGQCRLQPGDRHGRDTVPLLFWNGDDETDDGDPGRFYLSLALAGDDQETLGSCGSPWSFPVGLDSTALDVRRTTSAPRVAGALHTTVPLVVTCHTRSGTIYAVVARDANPLLHISNATSATLAFAESGEATEGTRGSLMLWSVPPGCSVHFTPPSLSAHCSGTAPGSERGTPQLLLACVREGGSPLMSWSSPVACVDVANQFVRIPNLGDVRVSAHRVCQTTHLLVQVVSRAEVSAKEIRSRIGESGPVMEVELRGSPDEMALGGQTDQSLPVTRSSPPRVLQEDLPAVSPLGRSLRFASLSIAKLCLIICDESDDYRTSDPRDHRPTELIRLSLDSLSCVVRPRATHVTPHHPPRTTGAATAASVVYDLFAFVGGLQLDNQLAGGEVSDEVFDFPVVLVPQEDSAPMQGCQDAVASVTLSLELHPGGRAAVDSLVVKLRPLSLFIEDTLLYRVARMASFLRPVWCHVPIAADAGDRRLLAEVAESSLALVRTVPVRELVLEPLMVRLSVHASLKLFLSLNGTPLSFARFSRTNLVTGCYQLGQLLTRHYVTGALFRAGWVVGSLDLLGNPTGLVRALGSGVSALVVLPYRGLVQGRPWAFLMGVSHGTSTMLRHISSGALSSVTQLATSVSRNLDRLSLDPEHLAWKESLRTGPSAGLGQGLSTLGISLLGAVAGIVDHPMQALIHEESRGPTGFVKGLGRGLVGAVAKPISGAAELVAQTGKGILQGTGWGECSRRRHQAQPYQDGPSSEARLRASLSGQELLLALRVELLQDGNTSQPFVLVLTWQTATRARVRVAEYVTRTSPYPPPSSDQDGGDCEPSAPSGVTCLLRLLQPNLRPWLLARFAEAKKAALGKGFHSPHS
ncbi:vacuolar protein-sorting protein, putative [Ixodes scapularis]|uniref:Vacuolar protein-sorting protein, putative n=1 Tax=Ixodes scapularis TaxID=6945 RepID=B7PSH8_IXOSC|nr:vacuolar protein-sorting protein, putative [Ixodes scapularis]|eukprot:XP_002402615.1 vacuolar protein-sorting protein, putative [Ixodes scapularis]